MSNTNTNIFNGNGNGESSSQQKDYKRDETIDTSSDGLSSSYPVTRRTPDMSVHRRRMLHITADARESKEYTVPHHPSIPKHNPLFAKKCYKSPWACAKNMDWLGVVLPCTKWMRAYSVRDTLLADLIAGLTVGVMIIPQSMSYAKLAGLPVEYGLYSSLVPVFSYALFGSSRQLAVGPVALISLMLNSGLTSALSDIPVDDPSYQETYNTLAIQTSFLVGVAYIIMGVFRMGFVTIFLSHAVVSGFTTGAAIIIGMSQLEHVFGYDIENSKVLYEVIGNLINGIDQFNWRTFLMGFMSFCTLLGMKHLGKTYPKRKWMRAMGPLTVTVVTIVLTVAFDLEAQGIPVVGTIPKGLPSYTGNLWTPIPYLKQLWLVIVSITIVGFMEAIAIAKQLASKHNYEVDSSRELLGLGMANFLGAMFHCYPVTGSFSRSAVNNEAGAKSGVSGMITSILVAVVLLFLTPVFERLPLAVLAAIVLSGVIGLIDYEEAIYLWKVHKFDFCIWTVACMFTMFFGVEIGLGIAVCMSLLMVIYESAVPLTSVLGRLPGTTVYRNVKQYPAAERYNGIVAVRIDAPIYFANTQMMREKIDKYQRKAEALWAESLRSDEDKNTDIGMITKVKFIVIDLSPVSHIDTSGLHILMDMLRLYKARGIQMCLVNPNLKVMGRLKTSGVADGVGTDHIFVRVHDANTWCLNQLDAEALDNAGSMAEYGAIEDVEEGSETLELKTDKEEVLSSSQKDSIEVMQI